ncbi:hypothetical protein LCGC14_0338240 [marine sediment metagenome]|uniref:Bacteriophage Mu Gam like protein n=1 Tax=marine sediment metagenome TaxID=412755 RepID=A0A0F9TEH4_9ZZZZ
MQESQNTVESAIYWQGYDEPLPAVIYQDPDGDLTLGGIVVRDIKAEQEIVKEQFKIDDQGKANWAIRRIREAHERAHGVDDVAQKELDRIMAWKNKVQNKEQREIDFFESRLRDYAHDELAKSDGNEKSIPLSEGTLKFIRKQPKLRFDAEKLIQELESEGLEKLIRRKTEPNLVEIKAALRDGFEIKAITLEEQEDSFTVSLND